MEEPVGIKSRNVRASACGDDDGGLCLSYRAVIALDLCLLPLSHNHVPYAWMSNAKIGKAVSFYKWKTEIVFNNAPFQDFSQAFFAPFQDFLPANFYTIPRFLESVWI